MLIISFHENFPECSTYSFLVSKSWHMIGNIKTCSMSASTSNQCHWDLDEQMPWMHRTHLSSNHDNIYSCCNCLSQRFYGFFMQASFIIHKSTLPIFQNYTLELDSKSSKHDDFYAPDQLTIYITNHMDQFGSTFLF